MDRYNVEKAIITTINRTKYYGKQKEAATKKSERDKMSKFLDDFKKMLPKGQLSHSDVIDIANKAPERFYKFFWFNPKLSPNEEENSYKILEDHFKKGFCGVKIHPGFNLLKIPKDILKLLSFMLGFDKELIFFFHSMPKTGFFSVVLPKDIASMAKEFPHLRIIVGHAAYCMDSRSNYKKNSCKKGS